MSGAKPAYAPYVRFARNVLIVDLAMGVVVFVVSIWQGWTSTGEATLAILGGGAALIGVAILPGVARSNGMALGSTPYSPLNIGTNLHFAAAQLDDSDSGDPCPGFTWTLLVAGFIPVVYAAAVAAFIL